MDYYNFCIERLVSVGDTVTPSQVIARLDPQDVKDNLTAE